MSLTIITLFCAAFGAGISTWILIDPDGYTKQALRFIEWPWMPIFEPLSRFIIGVLFVMYESEAAYPTPIRYIGFLLMVIGVGLALTPPAAHRRFGRWVIPKIRPWLRPTAVLVICLMGLLLVATFGWPRA